MKYAKDTRVSPQSSRQEIEDTLRRYGATGFAFAEQGLRAAIQFEIARRRIRFVLPLRPLSEFEKTATGGKVSKEQAQQSYRKAERQRWRALALAIKAKLEAVESGITTFEEEFMAHIVLPNGGTVGEWMMPQIESAYTKGTLPPLLPGS